MAASLTLRFSPEYGCWPTWDDATGDCLDPAALGLPQPLVERIQRWDDLLQTTLDQDYPPDSRFADAASEAVWRAEGEALFQALSDQFGADRVRRGHGL